jgi:transcriptional regulator with XRE-family HTH domain
MRVVFYLQFDYTSVGKHIQHYRTSLNKTQEELAEQADISKNYLSKLENAQARGRLDKYYSVAQALGVTVDMLIDNSSDRASGNDYFFSNQLLPLVSSLSVEQRKMLIDFIELLKDYDVDKNNTKRG